MHSLRIPSVKQVISCEATYELKNFLLVHHRMSSTSSRGIHRDTPVEILDLFVEIDAGPIEKLLIDWSDTSNKSLSENLKRISDSGYSFWNDRQKYIFETIEMLVELEHSHPDTEELFEDVLDLEDKFTFIAIIGHMWRLYEELLLDVDLGSSDYAERMQNLKNILEN